MGYHQVWVRLMQLVDKIFKHHAFILEHTDIGVFFLPHSCLEIRREWKLVKLAQQCEVLVSLVLGCTILVYLLMDQERDHGNLTRVGG